MDVLRWLTVHLMNLPNLLQMATIIATLFGAMFVGARVQARLKEKGTLPSWLDQAEEWLVTMTVPAFWLLFQGILYIGFTVAGLKAQVLTLSLALAAAWLAIHFIVTPIKNKFMERTVATVIWIVAALSILGVLDQTIALLDAAAISVGEGQQLSLLAILRGIAIVVMLIWLAVIVTNLIDRRTAKVPSLTGSAQVLITKVSRIVLIIAAVLVGLSAAGIDLTVFAVVGGAVGLEDRRSRRRS